jgi:ATP-binding cassette subfamily B protein
LENNEESHELRAIFENLSLTLEPKSKVGLVGFSGAGKTTLIKLLMRYYDVDDGSISIDGVNIKDCSQSSLRNNIALIPQDPILFHRSIKDNIKYGSLGATHDKIVKAAKVANCHEFVMDLPQGYDTLVGERGTKLSGGQCQRIGIARAVLKDAPILILDEATSALDSYTEKLIQNSLDEIMKNRTVLAIAHRLSTLQNLDRIVVLEHGKILEDGTHSALLSKGGKYAQLWKMQVDGYIVESK